ncbi:MAG: Rieske (2Fe-2S) protein [Salinirussus sp.]
MTRHFVCEADELEDGDRALVSIDGVEIGVFRIDGNVVAFTNWCPHQSGPICEGTIAGTAVAEFDREQLETEVTWDLKGTVLTCPWHSWEFDATSGECLSRSDRRLIQHDVFIEDNRIYVER